LNLDLPRRNRAHAHGAAHAVTGVRGIGGAEHAASATRRATSGSPGPRDPGRATLERATFASRCCAVEAPRPTTTGKQPSRANND
jgi:hypothetical protein